MFGKGTKLYSILHFKCPQCHEGDFFVSGPYNLKTVGNTHKECSHCGLIYSKEPGFYYGAMYVSYALGVALFVACWIAFSFFLPGVATGWQIAIISTLSLIAAPYFYALSKIIWANLFFRYDSNALDEKKIRKN